MLTRYLLPLNGLLQSADEARDRRQWSAAALLYSRYLARKPDDAPIWVQLGHAEKERGNVGAAKEAYERARELTPDDIEVHLHIGLLFHEIGQNAAASAAYDRASQLDTKGAEPHTVRAMADLARNLLHWQAAGTHYRTYLLSEPQNAPIWLQLGHAEKEIGNLRSAWDAYEHAATLSPEDAEVHLQIGHVLRRMNENAMALQAYCNALQIDRTVFDAEATRSVGDLARDLRKWDVAVHLYEAYLQAAPDDGPLWVQLGHARKEIGDIPGARQAYEQALRHAPDNGDSHVHLASLLRLNGDTEAALDHYAVASANYRMYLQRKPLDASVWIELGHAERESGNLSLAWDAYDHAVTLSPNDAKVHLQIGHVLRRMDDPAAALQAYRKAFQINPTMFGAETIRSVGNLASSLRKWEFAAECYSSYLETTPDDGAIWMQLGEVRRETGDFSGARYAYEKALSYAPDNLNGRIQLASVLKRSGEAEAALDHYEAARQLDPSAPGIDEEIERLCLMVPGRGPRLEDHIRQALRPHFDADFYLRANPDLADLAIDLLAHYHFYGWRERRNPTRLFNTAYYLATNDDVAAANMNPLLHWVWAGRAEGRLPIRELDVERGRLETMRDPRSLIPDWAGAANNADPMRRGALRALLRDCAGLVVSVSHDDYARNPGGVQNLIGDEQSHCVKKGWSYLHISPAAPIPVLADEGSKFGGRLSIRLDGVHCGIVTGLELALDLGELRDEGVSIVVTVHHLMGHAPENLLNVIRAAGDAPVSMWVHDFFTICPSYTLMRNDVKFCGGPPIESGACSICCYRGERERHQARISALFAAVNPRVTAPSQGTLDLWVAASALRHQAAQVEPLVSLFLGAPTVARLARDGSRRLRVAHLGARVYHKGWHVFEDLAMQLEDDTRYEFLQLGKAEGPLLPGSIRHVPVNVTPERRNAMVEAIAKSEIDIVVMWAVWPETFSYTTHEALAGGAFVVAYREAGNVWPAVQLNARNQGCAVDDRNELLALFHGKELAKRAMQPRARGAVIPENWLADRLPQLADIQTELTGAVLIGGGT